MKQLKVKILQQFYPSILGDAPAAAVSATSGESATGKEDATVDGNGGLIRLLYVHEDIMGNTWYYTKDNGQSFAELEYDVWGAPTSPSKLVNNDNGNFAAKSSAEFGRAWEFYLWLLGRGAWISSGYSIFWWRDNKNYGWYSRWRF